MLVASEFGTGDVFWSLLWFFLWIIWIWMLVTILSDIFRSNDLGGWGKALWTLFVIVLPYIGVLVYLIARGSKMTQRAMEQAQEREAMVRSYVQTTAASPNAAEQIKQLADLKASGALTDEEFQSAKAKVLG